MLIRYHDSLSFKVEADFFLISETICDFSKIHVLFFSQDGNSSGRTRKFCVSCVVLDTLGMKKNECKSARKPV